MQKRCPWILDWHSGSEHSSVFYHLRQELRLFRKVHLRRRKAHIDPVDLNQPHGRFTLKVRNGTIEANCKRGAILISQRMVDTPAAIGEKRKTERYGAIQHPFDAGPNPPQQHRERMTTFSQFPICAPTVCRSSFITHCPGDASQQRKQPWQQAAFLFASMTEKPLVSGKTAESTFGIKSWMKIAAMVCPDNPFLRNSICVRLTAVHRPSA